MFISLDLTFTLAFVPGLLLALFGIFWIAGPVTLLVLPLAALWNLVIYRIQTRMLKRAEVDGVAQHRRRARGPCGGGGGARGRGGAGGGRGAVLVHRQRRQ